MSTGKLYNITTYISLRDSLLDKYGAYNETSNLTGVLVYYLGADSIIFKCSRLSDKVIRIYKIHFFAQYGVSWTSGDAINSPVTFGGSDYSSSTALSGTYLVLSDNAFVLNRYYSADLVNDRLIIIGKMTNGKYIVMGAYSHAGFSIGTKCTITTTNEDFYPITSLNSLLSSLGEIYKSNLYISKKIGGLSEYNSDGTLAYILDVSSAYYNTAHPVLGTKYLITSSMLFMEAVSSIKIANGLLVELA